MTTTLGTHSARPWRAVLQIALSVTALVSTTQGQCTPPPAPLGVTASWATACSTILVQWQASPGATFYDLFRSVNNSPMNFVGTVTGTSANDGGPVVQSGIPCTYSVLAIGPCGGSGPSNTATGLAGPPWGPSGFSASTGACGGVTLSWNASAGATSYGVYRNTTASFGGSTQIAQGLTTTSFLDTGVTSGQTYWYFGYAANACGPSPVAGPVSGSAYVGTPAAPTNLQAADGAVCSGGVSISWNAVAGATGYELYGSTTNNSAGATLVTSTATTSAIDPTALPGVLKYYWVRATNPCGASAFSAVNSGYVGIVTGPTPNASDGTVCGAITVTWSWVGAAQSFLIERAPTAAFTNPTQIATVGGNQAFSFTDSNVAVGQTWFYRIRVTSACGIGTPGPVDSGFPRPSSTNVITPASLDTYVGNSIYLLVGPTAQSPIQWFKDGVALFFEHDTFLYLSGAPTESGNYTCQASNGCVTQMSAPCHVIFRPHVASALPSVVPLFTPASPVVSLAITGSGFTPTSVVYADGAALPTTYGSSTALTCQLGPTVPHTQSDGALALAVTNGTDQISNVIALPVGGVAAAATNLGVVSREPLAPTPGQSVTMFIQGVVPNAPYTLFLDIAPQSPYVVVVGGASLLVGIDVGTAFHLTDGIGLFGAPSGATFGSNPGGTAPFGALRVPNFVTQPNPPFGLPIVWQAAYLDAVAPGGVRLTWPRVMDV